MLKQRVITAFILLFLLLAILFKLPETGWIIAVGMLVMQGCWEWQKLSKMRGIASGVYCLLTLLLFLLLQQKMVPQVFVYTAAAVFWIVWVPGWLFAGWKTSNPWLMAVVGWLVLLPTGLAMLDLRAASPQPWWLLGVMALVWMADISAYFAGRKFGKTKLAPSISPGKTWEGVAGAMLGVMLYVAVVLAISGLKMHYTWFVYAAVGVALSVIGDLFESAIKRQAGVKDSGALLPGHGGLLDRIDALTSTLPLAALTLILMKVA